MRRLLALLLSLVIALCACGGSAEPDKVSETDDLHIDGIYLDSTSAAQDGESLVYLFYTVSAQDQALAVDSISATLTVDGTSTYQAAHYPKACAPMDSYSYTTYLRDVSPGQSLQVVETFRIPQKDLAAGKTLTFAKDQIPQMEDLLLTTDDIIPCQGPEAIAQAVDPDGYAQALALREEVDPDTAAQVQAALNGRAWTFYASATTYRVDFLEPNCFLLTAPNSVIDGTYTVQKGFIHCKYTGTGAVLELPYAWQSDGTLHLDFFTAFTEADA